MADHTTSSNVRRSTKQPSFRIRQQASSSSSLLQTLYQVPKLSITQRIIDGNTPIPNAVAVIDFSVGQKNCSTKPIAGSVPEAVCSANNLQGTDPPFGESHLESFETMPSNRLSFFGTKTSHNAEAAGQVLLNCRSRHVYPKTRKPLDCHHHSHHRYQT